MAAVPSTSIQALMGRMALLEAQGVEAMRDVNCLYRAERARTAELELARAQMLAYADDLRSAFQAERARRAELERAYVETVRALACAIEARDPYTGGHVDRVAAYATSLGRELGWSDDDLRALEVGALLHDIGKIAVADAVLQKTAPLDEHEWAVMRLHPTLGADLVRGWAALQPALPAVLYHHERYDGSGYPTGLAGPAIPAMARIVAVADAFDAMLTDRPYRAGLPLAAAVDELARCAGTQFDPAYTAAFLATLRSGRLTILKPGSNSAA
jgi:HD-GYP domain-containing protein (c-di-GMP phosphodiesterase class II)